MSAGPRKPHCTETPEYWEGLARDERSFAQDRHQTVESQLLHKRNAEEYERKAVEIRAKLAAPRVWHPADGRPCCDTCGGDPTVRLESRGLVARIVYLCRDHAPDYGAEVAEGLYRTTPMGGGR